MTSKKKRARERNKKKAAAAAVAAEVADAENRPPTPTATTLTTATDTTPDDIKEDTDMCVHGLNLQYNNEALKQIIDLCDDAAPDIEKVQMLIYGNSIPRAAQGQSGQMPTFADLGTAIRKFLRFYRFPEGNSDEEVLNEFGITFILLFKYPDEGNVHIRWSITHFLSEGTKCLLRGDFQTARGYAFFANYFEQTLNFAENWKWFNGPKLAKFLIADEHTLCSYFRNRIPCSCLGNMYKEVKSVVKKDMCWNVKCKQPDRFDIDSKSMMVCSRCRQVSYCSRECQEIDWHAKHKMICGGLHRNALGIFGTDTEDSAPLESNTLWNDCLSPQFSEYDEAYDEAGDNAAVSKSAPTSAVATRTNRNGQEC